MSRSVSTHSAAERAPATASEVTKPLAPQRLLPFEQYMLRDDRPGYAMTFPVIWEVAGVVDREAWQAAVDRVLNWHPMLRARLDAGGRHWRWQDVRLQTTFLDGAMPAPGDRRIDRARGPLLRCTVIQHEAATGKEGATEAAATIEFVIDHAAADGVSALEFCGDVFAVYAALRGGIAAEKLRKPEALPLERRGELDVALPEPLSRWVIWRALFRETWVFLTRRAEPLATPVPASDASQVAASGANDWVLADHRLSAAVTERVTIEASKRGATLNDWCLLALLRTIAHWNDQHAGNRDGWLVVNMPVHMRSRQTRKMGAANAIGYAFIARKRADLQPSAAALQALAAETTAVRKWKMGGMFLLGLATALRIPGAMAVGLRLRPASCVATHVGDPTRRFRTRLPRDSDGHVVAGDLVLRGLSGAAPVRPGTEFAGLVSSFAGQLALSVRLSPMRFTPADACRLAKRWCEEMERLLQESTRGEG